MNARAVPAPLKVLLARPRGFCAGVIRAIEIVERALDRHGAPVYVRHEIVHNHHVVQDLRARGAIFVDSLDQVPTGAITVFSAHGVSRAVETEAGERGLDVIDATCPLVLKVHRQGRRYAERDHDVVLIGHEGHVEVEGTRGQIDGRLHVVSTVEDVARLEVADPERVAYITQTTLSVNDTRTVIAALQARFPAIVGPDINDICYATQNRQSAVLALAPHVDMLLVVGAHTSSNSNRLRELGEQTGLASYLIADCSMIDPAWLEGVARVGLTAGASAPERLVQDVIDWLDTRRDVTVETLEGINETIQFRLPQRLQDPSTLTTLHQAV